MSLAEFIEYDGGPENCAIVPEMWFCLLKKWAKWLHVVSFW